MARARYVEQLEGLRDELADAIAALARAVPEAANVLLEGDLVRAEHLIVADALLDARMAAVEEECFSVLALQAPVAGGLRQVLAAMRIAGEISRSGDLVVNVCKAARRIYGHPIPASVAAPVRDMADRVFVMFAETSDACAAADAARIVALRAMDAELDDAQARLFGAIFAEEAANGMDPQMVIQVAIVGRFYERLGDHAVNIAERIAFAGGAPPSRGSDS